MRLYNRQHGNLEGIKEDSELCIVEVGGKLTAKKFHAKQCPDKRGYGENGLFCEFHADLAEKGRCLFIPKDEE